MHQVPSSPNERRDGDSDRRAFLKKASATILGGLAMAAPVASGVYLYRVHADRYVDVKKMVLLK